MDFRILGPLEALDRGQPVSLGGTKRRAVLALLLLHANETLSTDRLVDELWGDNPPATAAKTVQVHISRLRRALVAAGETELVVTREHGYELLVDPEQIDARRFERLVAEGRAGLSAGDPEAALTALEEAVSLWRGQPLADLAYEPFVQPEAARLVDLRVTALETLVEAKLAVGRHTEVIGQLENLIADYPYREALRGQLMLALYRADRQADALQVYQDTRRHLVEELGIEPGERLRELERAVLAQDPALAGPVFAPPPDRVIEAPTDVRGPPPADGDGEIEPVPSDADRNGGTRRLVSIVFADLVGSTGLAQRLDPETLHRLLDRYSEVCGAAIERHGGTVEGFIGDAVVGVFGLRRLNEDDALRAVRAAVELREACRALSAELERERGVEISMKLGIESGEVFLSPGTRRAPFAVGDAYNVASRLEGTAARGEILLGENVYGLVRDSVRAERLDPLVLKGRTGTVRPWRLLGLDVDAAARALTPRSRYVGRERELETLRAAFARALDEKACQAVAIVGPAGIGKSRLALEFASELEDEATVAVGRCLSYGEGVAYRPLAEIVQRLGESDPSGWLDEVLEGDEQAARLVLSAIGVSDRPAQAEEIHWAVRRLFERVAGQRPLVIFVEDVHWAEPALLDLLDYLVAFSSGPPILLACLARPEFLETRPAWAGTVPGRSLVVLDALSDVESRRLLEGAGGAKALEPGTAVRIVETAEGNPLFLEQLAAVGAEKGETALPSTIQAVLAARIDHLEPEERAVIEHASVEGRIFHVGSVAELLGQVAPAGIAPQLVSLVQKQLIRPDRSAIPGEDAFRFAHVLIREAAYQGVPKQRRAELHERMARWLEQGPAARDESVGYHLEEAYRHLTELGRTGERERALAAEAAERLAAAADAALLRGDPLAGARLLESAAWLLEPDEAARAELLPELGASLFEAGRMPDATRILDDAIARAPEPRLRARAQVERELVRLEAETSVGTEQAGRVAEAVLPVLKQEGDDYGQSRVWLLRGQLAWNAGRAESADGAWSEAAASARRAGDQRELFEVIGWRALAAVLGPTPVDEAIRRCEDFRKRVAASPFATATTLNPLALLHAMKGHFGIAEQLLDQARAILQELGGLTSAVSHLEARVRLLAGQPALAETQLRADVETLSAMSGGGALATTTALLAQAVYAQARMQEAGELCRTTDDLAAPEDAESQVIWRGVQAKVLARGGRCEEAEALAREAVALVEPTDLLSHRGDAMLDLADVLRTCGRTGDADRATRNAVGFYELKGNAAAAWRARSLLDDRQGGM
jgi:DNA-binding SARP family transcriptional activator/class 3 adenylate cyclase/tetratricopeptide (TPR) repeat protein